MDPAWDLLNNHGPEPSWRRSWRNIKHYRGNLRADCGRFVHNQPLRLNIFWSAVSHQKAALLIKLPPGQKKRQDGTSIIQQKFSSYWIAKVMNHKPSIFAIFVLILILLILTACNGMTVTPSPFAEGMQLSMSTQVSAPCEACAQATLAVALTQEKNNADNQAAATAEIARANAQATLSSANATVSAAQTQDQNNANVIAAQVAATAEIVRANAQATLNSAGATQSAALAQDAIRQTQAQYDLQVTQAVGTQDANAMLTQQNKNDLAAGTQTVVANLIATQTQSAAATSQWYTDQSRQREEQRQGPIAFLWMWCLPTFIVLLAGLALWGFWRWMKIQQANQRIVENPVGKLQAPAVEVIHHQYDDSLPYLESDVVDGHYQLTQPEPADQVQQWVDEVKDKLQSSDEEDEDDNTSDK
jgi:hypothetical protein